MILGPNTPYEKALKKEIIKDIVSLPKTIFNYRRSGMDTIIKEVSKDGARIAAKIGAIIVLR